MMQVVVRHAIALLPTLGALAVSPFLAHAIARWLSHVFGDEDEFYFLALTWSFGDKGDLDNAHFAIHPASLAVVILLATIAAVCIMGEVLLWKWSALSWALPLLVAIPFSVWIAFLARRAELSAEAVATIAVTLGVLAFLLVGIYWWTLRAMSAWRCPGTQ
jgi:hypothetical protein